MKTITYQQLRKLPADTFFSTLSANNELGELWLTGEYPWGARFVYSALSDVSGAGRKEVDFEDNTFDRKGHFIVWAKDELDRYMDKVEGILSFAGAPVASEGVAAKITRSIGVSIVLDRTESEEQERRAESMGVVRGLLIQTRSGALLVVLRRAAHCAVRLQGRTNGRRSPLQPADRHWRSDKCQRVQ